MFEGFSFDGFWDDDDYSLANYVEASPSGGLLASIETDLGFVLPASYVELARLHNGGMLERSCFPMNVQTSWATDHIQVTGLDDFQYYRAEAWSHRRFMTLVSTSQARSTPLRSAPPKR